MHYVYSSLVQVKLLWLLALRLTCTCTVLQPWLRSSQHFILRVWNDCGHILRVFALLPLSPIWWYRCWNHRLLPFWPSLSGECPHTCSVHMFLRFVYIHCILGTWNCLVLIDWHLWHTLALCSGCNVEPTVYVMACSAGTFVHVLVQLCTWLRVILSHHCLTIREFVCWWRTFLYMYINVNWIFEWNPN